MELKTARLTVLIDPAKKQAFEQLCHTQDMTPSQVMRRLIRDYMDQQQTQQPQAASRTKAKAPAAARKAKG